MENNKNSLPIIDIKGLRESKNFSLRAFGNHIGGVSSSYLSKMERGLMPLSDKFMRQLSMVVTVDDLKPFVREDLKNDVDFLETLSRYETSNSKNEQNETPSPPFQQDKFSGFNLRTFREHERLTVYELGRKLSVSPSYISKIERQHKPLSLKFFRSVLDSFGEAKVLNSISGNHYSSLSNDQPDKIPFYSTGAKSGSLLSAEFKRQKEAGYVYNVPFTNGAEYIIPANDLSFEPEIKSGATIGVKKVDSLDGLNTGRIYLIITKEDIMLRHIEYDMNDDSILWLSSPRFPKFKVLKGDVVEVFRVCFAWEIY